MATAAATRPSGPVLAIPNYGSASPNRLKLAAAARSPAKSVSVSSPKAPSAAKSRQSCMCSPTNHPGSFRCSLHKERKQEAPASHGHSKLASPPPTSHGHGHGHSKPASPPSLAVVSIGSVAGDGMGSRVLARRALARSPQSQLRRRFAAAGAFRPRPSRLSAVSFAGDRAGDNRQ